MDSEVIKNAPNFEKALISDHALILGRNECE